MKDPFHETKEALNTAKREFTSVNSLNAVAAYSINQACENAIRSLWTIAMNGKFPYEEFVPHHKPALYIKKLGIIPYYSEESQRFLEKLTGYALDEVRFEGTQAYIDHTNPKSHKRGKELIDGTEHFITETEKLSKNDEVLIVIKQFDSRQRNE